MTCEKLLLLLKRFLDSDAVFYVLLRPQLDSDIAVLQCHILPLEHPQCVGSFIHDIDFGKDTKSSFAFFE